jgi:hypothetical protein
LFGVTGSTFGSRDCDGKAKVRLNMFIGGRERWPGLTSLTRLRRIEPMRPSPRFDKLDKYGLRYGIGRKAIMARVMLKPKLIERKHGAIRA